MPDITNPEAVRFCNERIRRVADQLAQTYYLAKEVHQEWTANNMGTIIAYNDASLVVDGSAADGRHPISGIDANSLMNRLGEFVADYEANDAAKLNTVLAVAVHPGG